MSSFQPSEAHNILALMLNPQYKGLGLDIQYVNKQKKIILQMKGIVPVLYLCIQDLKPK
jgi:hypothetical protein